MWYSGIHVWLRDDDTNKETIEGAILHKQKLDKKNHGSEESG